MLRLVLISQNNLITSALCSDWNSVGCFDCLPEYTRMTKLALRVDVCINARVCAGRGLVDASALPRVHRALAVRVPRD